jgi:hypothetical protein
MGRGPQRAGVCGAIEGRAYTLPVSMRLYASPEGNPA